MTASREYESSGIPLLIPQDYRGELLREHRTVVSSESVSDEESATEALSEITDRTDETHDVSATVGAQALSEVNGQREAGSLQWSKSSKVPTARSIMVAESLL